VQKYKFHSSICQTPELILIVSLHYLVKSWSRLIPYLWHLAMQWNSSKSKIAQHQCNTLGVCTRVTEDHERITSELIQQVDKVNVLSHKHH